MRCDTCRYAIGLSNTLYEKSLQQMQAYTNFIYICVLYNTKAASLSRLGRSALKKRLPLKNVCSQKSRYMPKEGLGAHKTEPDVSDSLPAELLPVHLPPTEEKQKAAQDG